VLQREQIAYGLLRLIVLCGFLLQLLRPALAQSPTVVDPSFDTSLGANDDVFAIALQPDGKVLIAGQFTQVNATTRPYIARLNSNGSLDLSFDPTNSPNFTVYALALQPDGRILIGGAFTALGAEAIRYVARLNGDGSPDTSFLTGTTVANELRALAIQPDGRIVIGGRFTTVAGQSRRRVARLLPDGTLDASFNPGTGANDSIRTLALQPDGKIVVGGQFTSFNGLAVGYLARLQTNGVLDLTCCTNANAAVRSVAVEPGGNILIGGEFTTVDAEPSGLFARLLTDGAVDEVPLVGSVARKDVGVDRHQERGWRAWELPQNRLATDDHNLAFVRDCGRGSQNVLKRGAIHAR